MRKISDILLDLLNFAEISKHFGTIWQQIELAELCKGVHFVDLGESFQTHIYLQNLASTQPRTSPLKFAARRCGVSAERSAAPPRAARPGWASLLRLPPLEAATREPPSNLVGIFNFVNVSAE